MCAWASFPTTSRLPRTKRPPARSTGSAAQAAPRRSHPAPGPGPWRGAQFDTVPLKGIDPLVQLGTLEALLTGRDYDLIVAGPRAGHALAIRNGGARVIVTLTDELQAALAEADDEQLESAALPWSQTDEFWGRGDPQALAAVLHELAGLARRAHDRDERLYCWVSL
jgi:hypothetical protein